MRALGLSERKSTRSPSGLQAFAARHVGEPDIDALIAQALRERLRNKIQTFFPKTWTSKPSAPWRGIRTAQMSKETTADLFERTLPNAAKTAPAPMSSSNS